MKKIMEINKTRKERKLMDIPKENLEIKKKVTHPYMAKTNIN